MKSRLGITLLALVAASCRPGEQLPPPGAPPVRETPPARGAAPVVRVGLLVDTTEVVVSAGGRYELLAEGRVAASGAAGEQWRFTADDAGRLIAVRNGERAGPFTGAVTVRPTDGGTVEIGGRPYRGAAVVTSPAAGRVTAINALEVEQYLLGVVPLEIGVRPRAEMEAMKAQAVAARTYTLGNLGSRERLGFDVYATVADQVYGGFAREDTLVSRAVRETAGEILTYNGRPIVAYYHSTCGGQTANLAEAWPWRAVQPYLRSTSDRIPGTDRHYCDASNRFRWSVTWSGAELAAVLRRTLPGRGAGAAPPRVQSVELLGRTENGRVDRLRVVADGRSYEVRSDSVRWLLRPDGERILNSALLFEVNDEIAGDTVQRLEVRGGGWGHGVGMCQFGAMGRARHGQSYREILTAYYHGARLERLY